MTRTNNTRYLFFALACFFLRLQEVVSSVNRGSRILQNEDGFEYEAVTDVSFFLNLAFDAADMRASDDDKLDIYFNGKHAYVEGEDGNQTNISFAGLSLGSNQVMFADPLYNVYRHAFYKLGLGSENDIEGNFDGHPVEEYGNTLVMDLFELNSTRTETTGALIINVWMAIAHEFANLQRECAAGGDKDKMNRDLDRAAALWIGADQVRGDNIKGHLLYNLAEQAGEFFDQDDGETWVNTQLMDLINTIQEKIAIDNFCDTNGYEEMRAMVNQAISYMTVPLVQMLIHHIINVRNEGGSDVVELYALSIAPRIAVCDPNAYEEILQLMVFESLKESDQQLALDYVQRIYSCLDITCQDVGSYESSLAQCDDSAPVNLAGYTPRTDVRDDANIDRDIKLIDILMFYEIYDTAKDVYRYGGLHDLATNQVSPDTSEQFELFNNYYNTNNYEFADNIINNVLDSSPPFDSASKEQRTEIVVDLLRSVVMYLATISQLESAVTQCEAGEDTDTVMELWDGGAAFYIGSIEGTEAGGQQGGEFLYGTAKRFCTEFGTCEPGGAAIVNNVMLQALDFGGESLSNNQCEQASTVVRESIQPGLYIPLIQGTLLRAKECENVSAGSQDRCMGGFYAFSRSILPRLDQAFPSSAEGLNEDSSFQPLSQPLPNGLYEVYRYITSALPHISTDCREIGTLQGTDFCEDETPTTPSTPIVPSPSTQAPAPPGFMEPLPDHVPGPVSEPKDLAWGRYVFTDLSAAESDSSISLDVRDMRQATSIAAARNIYTNGQNALDGGLSERRLVELSTLESLSTSAYKFMTGDALYDFYRFALYEETTFEQDQEETWPFADMVVKLALNPDNGDDFQLAAEAAVVMNIWMLIAHRLHRAAAECQQEENPVRLIDSAVALWIGQQQLQEEPNSGWVMYSIAQRANHHYGSTLAESQVNTDLIAAFNEAKVLGGFCETRGNAYLEMRFLVNEIIKIMTKPLVQNLLYYISVDDLDYTELYALSVIPQAASCKESMYLGLKAKLVDSFSRDESMTEETFTLLGSFFSCLGFTCEDLGDVANANSQLRLIVTNICSNIQNGSGNTKLAGYEARNDVTEQARIDLDIRQIDILMRTRSYDAATEIYRHGRNSKASARTLLSSQFLATDTSREKVGAEFELFDTFFGRSDYADNIITMALQQGGNWLMASREQLAEGVFRTLQSMVSYMAVLSALNAALDSCRSNLGGVEDLDKAVAYLVGSLEGPMFGGTPEGVLLYGLAKENCEPFDTCEGSGDASINEKLIFALSDMRESLEIESCENAASILRDRISPSLPVPLIQSSIMYAAKNEKLQPDGAQGDLVAGYILSFAVLPLVKNANSDSAVTIENNMKFPNVNSPDSDVVAGAFAQALRAMGINCATVGTYWSLDLSVCVTSDSSDNSNNSDDNGNSNGNPNIDSDDSDDSDDAVDTDDTDDVDGNSSSDSDMSPPIAPLPETPTNLGEDLYVTTTYVKDRADIALDVKEMEKSLLENRVNFAKSIYMEGENSNKFDKNGVATGRRSLGNFSLEATSDMLHEPLLNIFIYAIQDENGQYKGKDARQYADTIVQETFEVKSDVPTSLAAEAAVALNLWMYLVHVLSETLQSCKLQNMAGTDGVHSIDEAVAYWIGDGQVAGDSERGHLLYALAERMGEIFNVNQSGQSRTNTNILRLFHQAKIELSFPSACSDDPNTFRRLRHIVDKIISQMTIPLIQALIHNLRNNDADRVQVYAHAFVPMVSACNPGTFKFLHEKLIASKFNVVEVEDIIDQIRSTFPCFNIRCDDVGLHSTEVESSCSDPTVLSPLAGYKPARDVKEYAQLDLDILEIDILMQMKAYDAVEDLYTYGKHSTTDKNDGIPFVSLAQLATASGRSVVPQFDSFKRYYDGDDKYADTIIRVALGSMDGEGSNHVQLSENYTPNDLRVIVVHTCEYLILFMAALQGFYETVAACEAGDVTSAESWDKGAAYIIGHLEGTQTGGSDDGRLFLALSKKYCNEFGTCSTSSQSGSSVANKILSLLYAGRGALPSESCREVRTAANELESLLLIPLIQATLSYSLNTKVQHSAGHSDQVEAFVYASAVLPLIEDVDRDAAQKIKSNLEVLGSPLQDGDSAVMSAFSGVYSGLGVQCQYIGFTHGMDTCSGAGNSMNRNTPIGLIVGIVLCVLAIIASLLLWRAKQKSLRKENNPTFVTPQGELNHTEDLLRKSNAANNPESIPHDVHTEAEEAKPMVSSDGSGIDERSEEGDIV